MKTYSVTLNAVSHVSATIRGIEANSPEEAERKALELSMSGEAMWLMSGLDETTINPVFAKQEESDREYESAVDFQ